jgi:hypothetical protein
MSRRAAELFLSFPEEGRIVSASGHLCLLPGFPAFFIPVFRAALRLWKKPSCGAIL